MPTSNLAPPFQPGCKPGPGRPKGGIAQATLEIRAFCRSVVESAEYRQKLYDDAVARRLSPAVEMMLWDRAFGAVPKEVRIDDVQTLDTEDLLRRMRAIAAAMPDADVLQDAQLPEEIESGPNPGGQGDETDPPA